MLLMTYWRPFFVPSECLSAKICCSWSSDKFAKRATYEFFSALFLLLVGSGPKISKRRKTALQPNRTETLEPGKKKKKKMFTSSYLHAGVRKIKILFIARALCYKVEFKIMKEIHIRKIQILLANSKKKTGSLLLQPD